MKVKAKKKTKKSKAVRMKRSESVDSLYVMALNPKPCSYQNFIKFKSCFVFSIRDRCFCVLRDQIFPERDLDGNHVQATLECRSFSIVSYYFGAVKRFQT